jgi:hypothetical protein
MSLKNSVLRQASAASSVVFFINLYRLVDFSRLTYAPDLCSEKSLQDQWPEFVADILNFGRLVERHPMDGC